MLGVGHFLIMPGRIAWPQLVSSLFKTWGVPISSSFIFGQLLTHVALSNPLHPFPGYFSRVKAHSLPTVSFQNFKYLQFIQRLFLYLQWFILIGVIFVSGDII